MAKCAYVTPNSAALFPMRFFCSGVRCEYGPLLPLVVGLSIAETTLAFTVAIVEDGIFTLNGPVRSGKSQCF